MPRILADRADGAVRPPIVPDYDVLRVAERLVAAQTAGRPCRGLIDGEHAFGCRGLAGVRVNGLSDECDGLRLRRNHQAAVEDHRPPRQEDICRRCGFEAPCIECEEGDR